jgi:hypothetical protein
MQHPDPDLDFDDMRMILQGASCTAVPYYRQLYSFKTAVECST